MTYLLTEYMYSYLFFVYCVLNIKHCVKKDPPSQTACSSKHTSGLIRYHGDDVQTLLAVDVLVS